MLQTAIVISASLGIGLLALKKRVGFIVILVGQPFWLWFSIKNHYTGIFIASILYSVNSIYGWSTWGKQ